MASTTTILSVSLPVTDLDRAKEFYLDVLGFELVWDGEAMPGQRMVEVRPPGSAVGVVLLPKDTQLPIAIRMGTSDADEAFARVGEAGVRRHNDAVLRWEGVPPMFAFTDPDGNELVYLQDPA